MNVLIISNPDDEHTHCVCKKLQKQNCNPVLLYPETFGTTAYLDMVFNTQQSEPFIQLKIMSNTYDLQSFDSVWYRRPRSVSLSAYKMDAEAIDFARDEWKTFIHNSYTFMENTLWVSHPKFLDTAANKPMQLAIAKKIGLNIPKTLITNDPNEAKNFIRQCKNRVIVKPTGRGWVYNSDGEAVTFVLTNRLSNEDLDNLHEIVISPVTIQEEIPKAFELRVNIVGQECLAIKIDSQKSEISQVDWRRYDVSNTPYTPFDLPFEIESRCLYLCQMLGLEFGAIDLICQPNGKFVFLEVNGNGQFLWAEQLSNVKISDALVRLLTGITPPLYSKNFSNLGGS